MGYTHYWTTPEGGFKEEEWEDIKRDVKKVYNNLPENTATAGGPYKDEPLMIDTKNPINDESIFFNGANKEGEYNDDLGHETFSLYKNPSEKDWSFCKTARKPYDLFVCACLIICASNCERFSFASDGYEADWKEAALLTTEVLGIIGREVVVNNLKE